MATVGIGVDGTCMLICDQNWREAMTGSVSLYDRHGERLHTIYVGAAPEYGNQLFFNRMDREIEHVKSLYPDARFVGIADGAQSNWDFLGPHIDEQVLDFYHATQYLGRAASALFKVEDEREEWLDEQCHNLKHKHGAAQRILRELEQAPTGKLTRQQKKDLQACINTLAIISAKCVMLDVLRMAFRLDPALPRLRAKLWSSNGCAVRACDGNPMAHKSSKACERWSSQQLGGTNSGKRSVNMVFPIYLDASN